MGKALGNAIWIEEHMKLPPNNWNMNYWHLTALEEDEKISNKISHSYNSVTSSMGCEDSNGRIEHFKKITQIYERFVYVKSVDVGWACIWWSS